MPRPKSTFISGKDASKLALIAFEVRSGAVPSRKEIAALGFEAPAAREAAQAFVRTQGGRPQGKRLARARRNAAVR